MSDYLKKAAIGGAVAGPPGAVMGAAIGLFGSGEDAALKRDPHGFSEDSDAWLPEFPDISPRILNPENRWQYNELNNQTGGAFQRAIDRKNEEHFGRIRAQEERAKVQERLVGIRAKEEQLKGVLRGETEATTSALDKQLDRLLAESGIQAGEARGAVGANMAQHGLLRSSFATRALEDTTLQEQEQKARQRLQTKNLQAQTQVTAQKVFRTLDEQREHMQTARTLDELNAMEEQSTLFDETALRAGFKQQLSDMELAANDQNFLSGLVGGLVKAGGFLVGTGAV